MTSPSALRHALERVTHCEQLLAQRLGAAGGRVDLDDVHRRSPRRPTRPRIVKAHYALGALL
jgi:hypothetical protein